jgi:acyl-CoA synthetase (AMP-forming)/AMP-acid ligase II
MTEMTADELARDRAALRQRWREAGWHSDELLGDTLKAAAAARPGTCFHFHTEAGEQHVTAQELVQRGLALAGGLRALGLQPGDRLAVQMPTSVETVLLYIAALQAGAVLVPIVHIYGAAELGFILRQSGARFLAMPRHWRGTDFLQRLQACGELPALAHVIVVGDEAPAAGAIGWQALQQLSGGAPPVASGRSADDVCLLLYTSGTSAAPKGVQHSHNSVRAEWLIPFVDGDGPYFTPFPAGHIAGFNFSLRPIVTGTDMVFTDRWDAGLATTLIERYRVRLSGGTPFHLHGLLEAAAQGGRDLSSLKGYGLGGTGVTPEHVRTADAAGLCGARTYGLTEHSTVSVGWSDMAAEARAHTDGRVQPGTEVLITGDDGQPLALGQDGEILVRGPELFIGYTDAALDAEAFAPGGWFRTGDIGRLDAQGQLSITDRKKDIVIRGGENISSQEVERTLATHAAVLDCAVVAMPDERLGEKVCAFVVLRPGHMLDLPTVQLHFTRAGMARQKTPEQVRIVSELPRTASGKVKKAELRQQLRTPAPPSTTGDGHEPSQHKGTG